MSVKPGTHLGSYEIQSLIGAGGMGEVYLAYDTDLKREVAIKLLPDAFARDPDRVARFRREAQLLASLNHHNIATIYGLIESGPSKGLVMEYVSGETLAERVQREGPVPLDEALGIASQICEALEHAHEKNVIHRDLKPANVKLTPEGKVKVLDFGLAKAFAGDSAASREPDRPLDSNSPTVVPDASPTLPGVILGTAAYMSPEQAKGKTVDRRTDIWALGCVLYELLTGKQVFTGESVPEILGSIFKAEPDWSLLPDATPLGIRALLRRCLQKDATKRSRDASEIHLQIEEARVAASPSASSVVVHAAVPAPRRLLLYAALTCVAVASLTGLAVWKLRPSAATGTLQVSRSVIPLPPNEALSLNAIAMLALSPDGTHLAYVANGSGGNRQLYLRAMDALEARPIPGTEGAGSPFFSPDGQWIGFFTVGGSLKKVSASGGATLTLFSAPGARGGAWGPNDTIVFAPTPTVGLSQVSAAGGAPQPFTKLSAGETGHRWPQFLPDGKSILFTAMTVGPADDANIAVQQLDSSESKVLIRGGTYARYAPSGHLVYYRAGTLMAVPFDLARLEIQGTPAPVLEGVQSSPGNADVGQFSFSTPGTLVYVPGGPQSSALSLVMVDRHGAGQPLSAPAQAYDNAKLSPDGRRAALGLGGSIWIYDLARDTLTRLTFEGQSVGPLWTPDSKRIAYRSARPGKAQNIFWKPADGSGPEERLTTSEYGNLAGSFSPDGKTLVFSETRPETGSDIWVVELEGDPSASSGQAGKPRVWLQTPFAESTGRLSPDGHWMAYLSDESGRFEVYVRPFPGPGPQYQISTEGGQELAWSPKGNELFYRVGAQRDKMMVVDVQTQSTFSAGKPRLLFEASYYTGGQTGAEYSVTPDGQHFLMMKAKDAQAAALSQINVVQNWFEELKQKVPVK